ncbi:MAG: hypothetical protein JXR77_00840 [Lentisphaeria bacterium]|nr:hypothetical protein [Lentisphaeria bacterium]
MSTAPIGGDGHCGGLRGLVAGLWLPALAGLAAAAPPPEGSGVLLRNPEFVHAATATPPIPQWHFRERTGGTALVLPPGGRGAVLVSAGDTSRGDLLSSGLSLPPFRNLEVRVEFEAVFGSPVLFVGVRPSEDPVPVDQMPLPVPAPGERAGASVRIHTGASEGPYSLQLSILGTGVLRVHRVEAVAVGPYRHPERPAFVLDIQGDEPAPDGELRWKAIGKLRTVWGFPDLVVRHFTQITEQDLLDTCPGLLLVSGISPDITSAATYAPRREAIRLLTRYPAPLVAICGGHQNLARIHGSRLLELPEKVVGPTRLTVGGQDPLFEGLTRLPLLVLDQRHRFSLAQAPAGATVLASSENVPCEILAYDGRPWYSFQGHPETGWHEASPEATVLWRNLLRIFGLAE